MAQKITQPSGTVKTAAKNTAESQSVHFVFDKSNYTWLIAAVVVVILGFFLMSGTTDIYNTTKIVIAPLTVLAGFGIGFYAILKKPDTKA
jgi:F0F1-type ATP synthase assembly protein I